jgi:hypothetical protein
MGLADARFGSWQWSSEVDYREGGKHHRAWVGSLVVSVDARGREWIERQCSLCGRKGTRGWLDLRFLTPPKHGELTAQVMCSKPMACNARRGRR